jgi:hypothetical protein
MTDTSRFIGFSLMLTGVGIFNSGCTAPLSIKTNGEHIAQTLGIDRSDIRFLSYCTFDEIHEPDIEGGHYFAHGIVAVTGTHLHLVKRYDSTAGTARSNIVIPVAEIDGVGVMPLGYGPIQLQLICDEGLIVIYLKPKEGTYELNDLFVAEGVPHRQCVKAYHSGGGGGAEWILVPIFL